MLKKKNIYPAYFPMNNSIREEQVILLMISNGEGRWCNYLAVKKLSGLFGEGRWCNYLAVKKLSALLRRIMSSFL